MKFISHSVEETEELAFKIAKNITPPQVICLIGNLGAGKTAFTRGFARYFGVNKGVASPTFTILMKYSGDVEINHYDLYRAEDYDELCDIGFEDQIDEGISLIEWPDKFLTLLPEDKIIIRINYTENEGEREITVEGMVADLL
ncbi:MAG: tRNA (adenosine(37)-N6)-threonylcarbamoyltransferase complex ATPase subunit type 1 TsaE [Clostridia bacterium]|nr:tRNA (adenosine(37)-N6)-threonylcarbamoyltransferase complex ATPase subunit type 1 TsaE [Clostridia bacterium]